MSDEAEYYELYPQLPTRISTQEYAEILNTLDSPGWEVLRRLFILDAEEAAYEATDPEQQDERRKLAHCFKLNELRHLIMLRERLTDAVRQHGPPRTIANLKLDEPVKNVGQRGILRFLKRYHATKARKHLTNKQELSDHSQQ
jgi:hypothetical protein